LSKVATILGISATQVTQLVAQKFTSVTLPLRSAVVFFEPSSSTKVLSGAAEAPPATNNAPRRGDQRRRRTQIHAIGCQMFCLACAGRAGIVAHSRSRLTGQRPHGAGQASARPAR
jgi:hypothetical protein